MHLFFTVALVMISIIFSGCGSSDEPELTSDDRKVSVLIPLYIYPYEDNGTLFAIYDAASRLDITVVLNPNNGQFDAELPGFDEFIALTASLVEHDIRTLGYVYTGYGEREREDVESNILSYAQSFDVSGIFFDEASSDSADLEYYQDLSAFMYEETDFSNVVLNPGQEPDTSYVIGDDAPATELVIFENQYWELQEKVLGVDLQREDPDRFVCLMTDTPFDLMEEMVDRAIAFNCGHIYVTDNGWDRLPSYWEELVEYIVQKNQ